MSGSYWSPQSDNLLNHNLHRPAINTSSTKHKHTFYTIRTRVNCQLDRVRLTGEGSHNERTPRSDWPVDMSLGDYLAYWLMEEAQLSVYSTILWVGRPGMYEKGSGVPEQDSRNVSPWFQPPALPEFLPWLPSKMKMELWDTQAFFSLKVLLAGVLYYNRERKPEHEGKSGLTVILSRKSLPWCAWSTVSPPNPVTIFISNLF